jgi:hypothetical protein
MMTVDSPVVPILIVAFWFVLAASTLAQLV